MGLVLVRSGFRMQSFLVVLVVFGVFKVILNSDNKLSRVKILIHIWR